MALTAPVFANDAQTTWTFHVEPALRDGRPSIEATAVAGLPALQVAIRDIGTRANVELTSSTIEAQTSPTTIAMPEVPRNTYVGMTASQAGSDALLFQWRGLIRPKGQTLVSYHGRKEMLPPPDFDEYWNHAKGQLAKVPLKPLVTRVPDKDTTTGMLFKVELPTVEETTIVCWYFVPRAAMTTEGKVLKHCPAILVAPGYGAEETPIDRTTSGVITLSVNPRSHGPSRAYWKSPVEHMMYNITNANQQYYKLAFLDCLRGAQFLFSREEVDHKRVATEGGSQGGLFAIATAALEPRIACVCSNVTAFSDYPDGFMLARIGHHVQFRELIESESSSATLIRKALSYVDGANMATRLKSPVQIIMGGQDPVCPYICGVVTYNRVPDGVQKEIHVIPDAKHEVNQAMRKLNAAWYDKWLKLAE